MLKTFLKPIYYSKYLYWMRFCINRIFVARAEKIIRNLEGNSKKEGNTKIRVAFILAYPEVWNSVKSVYDIMVESDEYLPYILTLPKPEKSTENVAFDFAKNMYENVIDYNCSSEGMEILAKSDYVFYTRPYAVEYPEELKPVNVAKYAKICYIAYGYEFGSFHHVEVEYNKQFFPYCYMCFSENYVVYDYCKSLQSKNSVRNIYNIGYPRFDLISKYYREQSATIRNVLWTPRWSTDSKVNDGSTFLINIENLLDYFSADTNSNKNLIIRPHPLMFSNFLKRGIMSEEEIDRLVKRIDNMPNVELDQNINYLDTAKTADLIISDFTTMLIEFLLLDKPIIYCGSTKSFNEVGIVLAEAMTCIDPKNCIKTLDFILSGHDTMARKREEAREKLGIDIKNCIGKKICDTIVADNN